MTLVNKKGVTVTTENKILIEKYKSSGFKEKKDTGVPGQTPNPNGQAPNQTR